MTAFFRIYLIYSIKFKEQQFLEHGKLLANFSAFRNN